MEFYNLRTIDTIYNLPILGHGIFLERSPEKLLKQLVAGAKKFKQKYPNEHKAILWMAPFMPVIIIFDARGAKEILPDKKWNDKSFFYKFLEPWLGTGLLISNQEKWKSRRRMLTPAFHSRILEEFVEVMNKHGKILVLKIDESLRKNKESNGSKSAEIDILHLVTLTALDIICETACGFDLKSQENPDQEYIKCIYKATQYVQHRQTQFWFWWDWSFKWFSSESKDMDHCLDVFYKFTRGVIDERIANKDMNKSMKKNGDELTNNGKKKKQLAFLDLLIDQYEQNEIDLKGITEEVDTFMFEGHDTTSSALAFTSFLLAEKMNSKIQKNLSAEIDEKLSKIDDSCDNDDDDNDDRKKFSKRVSNFNIENADFDNLNYLDSIIREGLRIYPSVPYISRKRKSTSNWPFINFTVLNFLMFYVGRDPEFWEKPMEFWPERWSKSSDQDTSKINGTKMNTFSWIPFSAGSRNCIGQRFAVMEMKVVLSYLFKFFKFSNTISRDELEENLMSDIILRPKDRLVLRVERR